MGKTNFDQYMEKRDERDISQNAQGDKSSI